MNIRSFASRTRKLTKIQAQLWQDLWPRYDIKNLIKESDQTYLDLNQIFNRPSPKILEIGFGQGQSLVEMAENQKESDFIGVEVYQAGIFRLLDTANRKWISNLKVFWGDARDLILKIPDHSLHRIQVFFPDPWPKTRHHKRRLINSEMIELFSQKLKTNGILHLATDWQEYAGVMMRLLSQNLLFQNTVEGQNFSPKPDYRPHTKYENRGKRLGHDIFELVFEKR